jgi:predicted amidohydrolase
VSLPKKPVACVQPSAHNRENFDSVWPHLVSLVDEAGERGARLIVLPEATVPAYVLGTEPVPLEQIARASADIGVLAQRHAAVIVYGGAKIVDGRTFNAAVCIGPDGRELGYAAKQFLWHFDRRWFAPGETLAPIETPLGTLGLLVCADGRIPTIASTLVDRGATMLVMPTAWVTSGRDPSALENIQADLFANVRAKENGVPFVVSNKCGVERGSVAYCGKSAIIDRAGAFVARGSERAEEIVFGEVAPVVSAGRSSRAVAARELLTRNARDAADTAATRARIAIARPDVRDIAGLAISATHADCDLLIASGPSAAGADDDAGVVIVSAGDTNRIVTRAGVRFAVVTDDTFLDPEGLVGARMDGIDLFVWLTQDREGWGTRFARTRAAELRAFVIVFDTENARSFVVDPDATVLAGTFDDFAMAAFVYDRARSQATMVAPTTDVMTGLRVVESIRIGSSSRNEGTLRQN